MSELISGKEALIALANGEDVQLRNLKDNWYKEWTDYNSFKFKTWIGFFIEGESSGYEFRIKPRTITINGITCHSEGEAVKLIKEFFTCERFKKMQTLNQTSSRSIAEYI